MQSLVDELALQDITNLVGFALEASVSLAWRAIVWLGCIIAAA
jgi:hypothetical protein